MWSGEQRWHVLVTLCADESVARWRIDTVYRRVSHEKRIKWGFRVVNEFKKKVAVSSIHASGLGVLFRPGRVFPCDVGKGKRQLNLLKSSELSTQV